VLEQVEQAHSAQNNGRKRSALFLI
jgi:hypothetical protein